MLWLRYVNVQFFILIFTNNYKNITLFIFGFLILMIYIETNKNKKMKQIVENRKQTENKGHVSKYWQ